MTPFLASVQAQRVGYVTDFCLINLKILILPVPLAEERSVFKILLVIFTTVRMRTSGLTTVVPVSIKSR